MNGNELNERSGAVVDAAMKVHSALGPGLLESAYQACLTHELQLRGLQVMTQIALPVTYRGFRLEVGYRIDLLVDNAVVVEVKAIAKVLPVHHAQLLSCLRLSGHRLGLLINFHEIHLKHGIKRMVNDL
jgi:GxxExxY protein